MIESVPAQLRYVCSLAFGTRLHTRSLDRLVTALVDAREEFGAVGRDAAEALRGPVLDDTARREVQIRRFRKQAELAARTPYYGRVFAELGIEPRKLRWADLEALPPTPKEMLKADPDAFVPAGARPAFRALTTGTTGIPTTVYFSRAEFEATVVLGAISVLLARQVEPGDVVQLSVSSRALFPVMLAAQIAARVGAVVYQAGFVDPGHALALLAEKRSLPGHRPRANVLSTTPSYFGSLVERGAELGYRPRDFGVERIVLGGEIATQGLRDRATRLFGEVEYVEPYAATEIFGTGALTCLSGHLHFPVPPGLVEVVSLDGRREAEPGEPGTLVVTPFAPYRTTTVVLRYDTADVVRVPAEPPTCELSTIPATSHVLGKLARSIPHSGGWTFQRDVAEALETLEEVPLPARFGMRADRADGVAVEVVAREDDARTRRRVAAALERSVPLRGLRVVTDPASLEDPVLLRTDLREHSFSDFGTARLRPAEEAVPA
ncbi:MAG: phenylacetate--CoA ligase [Actinobacteria bacterium]|nr:MAG: phenylacetate--CoA ligase [Actinomycetota bacterium]